MTEPNPDLHRMREEYDHRAAVAVSDDRYSSSNPAYQWMLASRHQAIVEIFDRFQITNLSTLRILELGCGSGGVLQEFIDLGANPEKLVGVDLMLDRLRVAKERLPFCCLINANGEHLPFPSASFDMVVQFTAFSSVLDASTKAFMADEMLRVLKPGNGILWYDFIWNPMNRQTRGIPLSQVKRLFPGTLITQRRVTLAPPITRLILPYHQPFAEKLAQITFLNSHLLVWIKKPY